MVHLYKLFLLSAIILLIEFMLLFFLIVWLDLVLYNLMLLRVVSNAGIFEHVCKADLLSFNHGMLVFCQFGQDKCEQLILSTGKVKWLDFRSSAATKVYLILRGRSSVRVAHRRGRLLLLHATAA